VLWARDQKTVEGLEGGNWAHHHLPVRDDWKRLVIGSGVTMSGLEKGW